MDQIKPDNTIETPGVEAPVKEPKRSVRFPLWLFLLSVINIIAVYNSIFMGPFLKLAFNVNKQAMSPAVPLPSGDASPVIETPLYVSLLASAPVQFMVAALSVMCVVVSVWLMMGKRSRCTSAAFLAGFNIAILLFLLMGVMIGSQAGALSSAFQTYTN